MSSLTTFFNPFALRMAKIVHVYDFGLSECKRVNIFLESISRITFDALEEHDGKVSLVCCGLPMTLMLLLRKNRN